MTNPIRALVVDDNPTLLSLLGDLLVGWGYDVTQAATAAEALERLQGRLFDLLLVDVWLPVMTGLAATEFIMAYCPTPILIVSASTNRGELFRTYEALAAGALDVLEKPTGEEIDGEWERRLISTVKIISRIKVITHLRAKLGSKRHAAPAPPLAEFQDTRSACRLIALGASTGGPGAVVEILKGLPVDFPVPILFVIHLGRPFAESFAEWLDGLSPLRVSYAKDGEPLPKVGQGRVILAPPDRHLVVRQGKLRLTSDPERHSCRPSVDVLFESVARDFAGECAACLLTGMGRDGAEGLLAIRRAGGTTLAQDEATSVVFGMPREAILLGAADRVLPLHQMAAALVRLAGSPEPRRPS